MENNNKDFLLKEIDLIQAIINRMAHNSFLIKGWAITLIIGSLLLKGTKFGVFIAVIPLISFWILDAYFLKQERLYRKLFEWTIDNRLKTSEHFFDLKTLRFKSKVQSIPRTMVSITLSIFYGSISVLLIIYIIMILKYQVCIICIKR